MHTDHLRAFERIAATGNFSRAALELEIAQPTISARIRALEAVLGGALFLRGGRGVTLTPLGERFLPFARRALQVLDEGQAAARLAAQGHGGRVTVGIIESLTGGFFAAAVRRFIHDFPNVELFVRAEHSDRIVTMLADGVVMLGVMTWPTYTTDLDVLVRIREPLVLVAPPTHPLAGRGPVSLADVARAAEPLLLVRWGPVAQPLLERLAALVPTRLEVPIDSARRVLLHGGGAALLTRTLVAEDLAAGRLVELRLSDDPLPPRESALVKRHGHDLDPATTQFVALLRDEAARHRLLP